MKGICLNEDDSNYYSSHAGEKITREVLDEWVEQYAGSQVETLMLCVNCMRTSYGSEVWDPIWKGYDPQGADDQPLLASLTPEDRKGARDWIHTAWKIYDDGIDIYEEWIDRCRICGISPWISMRMNDIHNVDDERSYIHSTFWREHPEYRRVRYNSTRWADKAFDYGIKEVRDYHFKLIEEIAERYDFDGIELDWMRFGYHFGPGHEAQGAAILSGFMKEVRDLMDVWEKRRGHRILIGVRVPSRPQTAIDLGMDAVTWAKKGLADLVVVTPFWETIETDMPVETWKQLLDGTGAVLAAGLEHLLRPYQGSDLRQSNSLETLRGAAVSFLSRGVDCIYLFNYMDNQIFLDGDEYQKSIHQVGSMDTMAGKPRRHVLTYPDTRAVGEARTSVLPLKCMKGQLSDLRLHIGPKPEKGKISVILGAGGIEMNGSSCKVLVNGCICSFEGSSFIGKPRPESDLYSYDVPFSAAVNGYNIIEILTEEDLVIVWAEMYIVPEN
jgi:hypothetical protein